MGKYRIVTCSTCELPLRTLEEKGVTVIYYEAFIDGEVIPDDQGRTMSLDDFYDKIRNGAMPTTSQNSIGKYIEAFEPILSAGEDVLHIEMSSGITGSNQSAEMAKADLLQRYPDRKIELVDSLCASSGFGLLVDYAMELHAAGEPLEEAAQKVRDARQHVNHWFTSGDLTHFYRGGRISKTASVIADALNICPIMTVNAEGKLVARRKVRTMKKAVRELCACMEKLAEGRAAYHRKVFIGHSDCEEDAEMLRKLVLENFPHAACVEIHPFGLVIGSHTGPGTVALYFWGDPRSC